MTCVEAGFLIPRPKLRHMWNGMTETGLKTPAPVVVSSDTHLLYYFSVLI